MKRAMFGYPFLAGLAVIAFSGLSGVAQAPTPPTPHYKVEDLGVISAANPGPVAISNDGLIAETLMAGNAMHAAISYRGRTQTDLAGNGGLGGPNSAAYGVNLWGMAAGAAETASSNPEDYCGFGTQQVCRAFVWAHGAMAALPGLRDENGGEGRNSAARTVNDWGEVGGVAETAEMDSTCPAYDPASLDYQIYRQKPVLWSREGIRKLPTSGRDRSGTPFRDPDGVVFRMNDSGEAVGATGSCTGFSGFSYVSGQHAVLWRNGALVDLGNLGGIATPPAGSGLGNFGNFAYNINRSGHVVGVSGTKNGTAHAFLWTPEGGMQDVGTIPANGSTPEDAASIGLAIGDHDEIGGISFPADPNALPRAFLKLRGAAPLDLNSLIADNPAGLYLFTACSINARGQIVGLALDAAFNFHGYLATPVE